MTVNCTDGEKAAYEQAAIETDQTMSDWIRRLLKVDLDRLGIEIKRPEVSQD